MIMRYRMLLIGVCAAAVCAIIAGYSYHRINKNKVPALAASTNISMDTPVDGSQLTTISEPVSFAKETGALSNKAQLAGHQLSVSVVPGQPITANMISNSQDIQATLNDYVTKTHEQGTEMELPASTVLANLARAGQDIALTIPGPGSTPPQIIYPIHVLGIYTPKGQGSRTLLLFVQNSQYNKVAGPILSNQAHVILYPTGGSLPNISNASQTQNSTAEDSTVRPTVVSK